MSIILETNMLTTATLKIKHDTLKHCGGATYRNSVGQLLLRAQK